MYKLYNVKAWGSLAIHCLLEEMEVPYTNIWMTPGTGEGAGVPRHQPAGNDPGAGACRRAHDLRVGGHRVLPGRGASRKGMSPELGSPAYGEFMSLLHFMSTELYPTWSNLAFGGSAYAETHAQEAFHCARARERADSYWRILEKRLASARAMADGAEFSALDPLCLHAVDLGASPSEEALHGSSRPSPSLHRAVAPGPSSRPCSSRTAC
jgi:hypothetical protein